MLKDPPIVSGSNFEDLLTYYQPRLLPLKITPPNPRAGFRWRTDFAAGWGVSVIRAEYSSGWSYGADSGIENVNLGFLSAGAGEMAIGSKTYEQTPLRAALYAQPTLTRRTVHALDGNFAGGVLQFEASLVASLLTDLFEGAPLTSLELIPTIDLSTSVGQILQSVGCALANGMRDEQLLLRSPKAMALLSEAALRLILEELPHRLSDRLLTHNRAPAAQHIRQAVDYMRANLHLPMTMTDIARAVGVSSRTLRLGFRKHYEISPAYYLRRVRLEAVHAELSSPENMLPVSEVALKWGFTHMGRFAAQYRREYGTCPSETARRAGAPRLFRPQH
ncbi:AraC family transcriptional regulator [Bradyrhizobium sp. UFLA05-109]